MNNAAQLFHEFLGNGNGITDAGDAGGVRLAKRR
jgi:hypothetical protein